MSRPTTSATDLLSTFINSNSIRLNFTKGDGARRLISVTETKKDTTIKYPLDGYQYSGNLKFKKGGMFISSATMSGTSSCVGVTISVPFGELESGGNTYVVYEGLGDGTVGFDIINLNSQNEYKIVVTENTDHCYLSSAPLTVITGFGVNTEQFDIEVYDNRTRLPIQGASIAIKNTRTVISDFGTTDVKGKYKGLYIEEGRYEMSVIADNYESKILSGVFVQRKEPRRDANYRMFTSAGNTEYGKSVDRNIYRNKNYHIIYLDPIDCSSTSFAQYQASNNPSGLTKL